MSVRSAARGRGLGFTSGVSRNQSGGAYGLRVFRVDRAVSGKRSWVLTESPCGISWRFDSSLLLPARSTSESDSLTRGGMEDLSRICWEAQPDIVSNLSKVYLVGQISKLSDRRQ